MGIVISALSVYAILNLNAHYKIEVTSQECEQAMGHDQESEQPCGHEETEITVKAPRLFCSLSNTI